MGRNTRKRGQSDQRLSYIVRNGWYCATDRYVHMILSLNIGKKTEINMCVCVFVCVCVEGTFKIKIRTVILERPEGDIQRHLQLSELKSILY
jgi:hypothetical protein